MKEKFEALKDWLDDNGIGLNDIILTLVGTFLLIWGFSAFSEERGMKKRLEEEIRHAFSAASVFDFPCEGALPQDAPLVKVTAAVQADGQDSLEDPVFGIRTNGLRLSRDIFHLTEHKEGKSYRHRWVRLKSGRERETEAALSGPPSTAEKAAADAVIAVANVVGKIPLPQSLERAPHVLRSESFWADVSIAGVRIPPSLLDTLADADAAHPLRDFRWPPDENILTAANAALGDPMSLGYHIFQASSRSDGRSLARIVVTRNDSPDETNDLGDLHIEFTRLPPIAAETWTVFAAMRGGEFVPANLSAPFEGKTLLASAMQSNMSRTWNVWRGNLSEEEVVEYFMKRMDDQSILSVIAFAFKLTFALGMLLYAFLDIREKRG